ncbi:pyruvate dehydrogenase (acetyl-transferring) E1 component subunit alpha [Taklimakanibacter deserti]|uniref:pyruvate dehydrogenase (acetyl-transferring) E1 component subunit alpha n=1 Tax=Taklimakanibacter deserti TaxID=2267839 RepID=UPI000E64A30B
MPNDIKAKTRVATPPASPMSRGETDLRRFIDPAGKLLQPLPRAWAGPQQLERLYHAMVLTRAFDEKAIALQHTGRLGTYPSSLGQEAVAVGIAAGMAAEDILLPAFREHGAQLWRGVSMLEVLLYWGGDERGSDFKKARADFPVSIPVAAHFPQAAGVALALKLKGGRSIAVCAGGDGATSKGDFYEAINIAGVWKLPALFVINNNQWAISVPLSAQTAAQTLAQKAVAAGMEGDRVDGNDVLAVLDAVERAAARARRGDGPTLIEAVTYRLGDHTTSDNARRYRPDEDVSRHWKEEPIGRLRSYLTSTGYWTKEREEELRSRCSAAVEEAVAAYLATAAEPPSAMFDHLFATLPAPLKRQRDSVIEEAKGRD